MKTSTKATNTDENYYKIQRNRNIEFTKELNSIENWLDEKEISILMDEGLKKNEFKTDKDFVKLEQELDLTQYKINEFKIRTI